MSTSIAESIDVAVPAQVLQEAVKAVVETCAEKMAIQLDVDPNPSDPREANVAFGSAIDLTAENGNWQLAVFANKDSCTTLTRSWFELDSDADPELKSMADAVAEFATVAAGAGKLSPAMDGLSVELGSPQFMEGSSCIDFFAEGTQGMAQTIRGIDGLEAHVVIIWQEE